MFHLIYFGILLDVKKDVYVSKWKIPLNGGIKSVVS